MCIKINEVAEQEPASLFVLYMFIVEQERWYDVFDVDGHGGHQVVWGVMLLLSESSVKSYYWGWYNG